MRERDVMHEDLQLEEQAFISKASKYLIISYLNKIEFIEGGKSNASIDVFKTLPSQNLERCFTALKTFDGSVIASVSEMANYVIIRDINRSQVIFKQSLNFSPHTVIIDELWNKIFVIECFDKLNHHFVKVMNMDSIEPS